MSSASRILNCLRLGRVSFQRALDVQHACASMLITDGLRDLSRRNGILLVLEHDPVYTTGLRSDRYPSGVEQALRERGADFHRTNRGGLITFHGPGQLVAYPILNLKQMGLTIRTYVDRLEGAMMTTCSRLGVQAERHAKYTGVWVGKSKIGAIGVHTSQSITTHGLALNCSTDLSWFDHIVPCGIHGRGVTSLSKELRKTVTVDDAIAPFLDSFAETFQCQLTFIDNIDSYLKKTVKPDISIGL